jgi:hypothetical protein
MRSAARLLPPASRCALVTAALVVVLALAGCTQQPTTGKDFKGAEAGVAQTIADLQSDAQGRKPGDICSKLLSRALADELESAGTDCTSEMEKVISDADDFELEVTDVAITGNTATAEVKARRGGKEGGSTTFSLVREDGDWRLSDLGSS